MWLAQDSRPGPTVPVGRVNGGTSCLQALWSRAETTAKPVAARQDSPWLLPAASAAAATTTAAAESYGRRPSLMANWKWQPAPSAETSPQWSDLSLSGLAVSSPPPQAYATRFAAGYRGGFQAAAQRRRCSSSRRDTGSEGSEIVILDSPDESIDYPEDPDS